MVSSQRFEPGKGRVFVFLLLLLLLLFCFCFLTVGQRFAQVDFVIKRNALLWRGSHGYQLDG